MNKNKPFHNPGVRKQDSTRNYHPRNPGSGKPNIHSGKSVEEYTILAQAAMEQGDRVLAQTYYQYAEHALRMRRELEANLPAPGFHGSSAAAPQNNVVREKYFEALLEKKLSNV